MDGALDLTDVLPVDSAAHRESVCVCARVCVFYVNLAGITTQPSSPGGYFHGLVSYILHPLCDAGCQKCQLPLQAVSRWPSSATANSDSCSLSKQTACVKGSCTVKGVCVCLFVSVCARSRFGANMKPKFPERGLEPGATYAQTGLPHQRFPAEVTS